MNTRDVEAFVAVVETGSIMRAAAQLHLTQPGITRRIQALEAALDIALLDRQSKPFKPTAAGREVYELGRRVLRSVDDLMSLAARDAPPSGEMRIGVPPFLSELALATPIDRLREAFPQLSLRVTSNWSPGLLAQIERAELDVAAVLLPSLMAPPPSLIAHELVRCRMLVVAGRAVHFPAAKASLRELSAHRWVLNQDGCGMRSALQQALVAARLPFDIAVEAWGTPLQLSLVARGVGIGLVTEDMLAQSEYRDALRVVDTSDFRSDVVAWALHSTLPRRLAEPVDMLIDALRSGFEMRAPANRANMRTCGQKKEKSV
jgi:DNA-binding transcriptional LysR family regulator